MVLSSGQTRNGANMTVLKEKEMKHAIAALAALAVVGAMLVRKAQSKKKY